MAPGGNQGPRLLQASSSPIFNGTAILRATVCILCLQVSPHPSQGEKEMGEEIRTKWTLKHTDDIYSSLTNFLGSTTQQTGYDVIGQNCYIITHSPKGDWKAVYFKLGINMNCNSVRKKERVSGYWSSPASQPHLPRTYLLASSLCSEGPSWPPPDPSSSLSVSGETFCLSETSIPALLFCSGQHCSHQL